ncbi:NnrU family protein [Janthinobacterium sp. 17J80-10]|uniref:NnrU family protein n=1 Tax=Janthinobacterium sp. 17J80-10 TaxID=2497863 RepID=UPI001005701C|nr:NnrU family protein [Janthinobacterium sp. 17J80-10]QAU32952.1 protein NrnU [Janthinobacterium sp. 17J80-10]
MTSLILGLAIFLGTHSVRIFADDWRTAQRARYGDKLWKLGYTVLSLIGFALIIWGFGMARGVAPVLWHPPVAMRHIASLLTLISFILLAATYVPRNSIKARFHHPMVLGVTVWAFAHLLANGSGADLLLFGSFLVWANLSYLAARSRDRLAGTRYPSGTMGGTLAAVVAGTAAWLVFAFWLHRALIGVSPFPG